ncbi:thioredoxin family protein [Ancylomarina sp. YFZ004]
MVNKILPWFIFVALFTLIIIGFATKDKLNQFLSKTMINNASPELLSTGDALIDSLFNYAENHSSYEVTFLEFGAKGCSACRKIEVVTEDIRSDYSEKINVVFLNILEPESQILMEYYGIAVIPTQVLLNKKGKEFFRHSGYISTKELIKSIQQSK